MYLLLFSLFTILQLNQAGKPAYKADELAKCGIGIGNKPRLWKSSHDISSPDSVKKIMGYRRVDTGAMPWMTNIRTRKPGTNRTSYCSGSLISSKYVLTAAHCFMHYNPITKEDECKPADFKKLEINAFIGATDLRDGSPPKDRGVKKRVVGKKMDEKFYAGYCKFNDMVILELEAEVPVDQYPPICLLDRDEAAAKMGSLTTLKANVYISGYGDTPEPNKAVLYHDMIAPVFPCRGIYAGIDSACSDQYKGRGTCDGDSGGPLAVLLYNRYYVYGVISRGENCQNLTKKPEQMQFERLAPKMAKVRQHISK